MAGIRDRIRVGMDARRQVASSTHPTLIGRDWFTEAGTGSFSPPADAKWIVIRAVGVGGGNGGGGFFDGSGGGGVYARVTLPIISGDTFTYTVGEYHDTTGGGTSHVERVRSGVSASVIITSGGQAGSSSRPNGFGGLALTGPAYPTMDVQRDGSTGSAKLGGVPGNDLSDVDTLYLTGTGATPSIPASGFGAGCAIVQTGASSYQTYPGTGGVVVVEYWTGDPR